MSEKTNLNVLRNNLTLIINNELKDMRLLQAIIKEFSSKGLSIEIPSMLSNKQTHVDVLNDTQLIALTKSIFNYFTQYDRELNVDINPKTYFTDSVLTNYEVYTKPVEEDNEKTIVFEDVMQIDANTYWTYIKAPQFHKLRKAGDKIGNFSGIQRARKIVKLPNGDEIEKININKKGMLALQERFKKHNIKPTTITLTVLDLPNKDPEVHFHSEYKNFGHLEITPNFNESDQNYTPFIINDGNHRYTGICDAYGEDQNVADEGLGAFIFIMPPAEASQFVADTFEQNVSEEKHTKTLKNTPSNQLITNIISNSNVLRGKVTNLISECKATNALTYLDILQNCVKFTNIDVDNVINNGREARKIGKIIDTIINYLSYTYFEDNIEKMKEHNFLLKYNMFVGYIAIANVLKNNNDAELLAGDIADKLIKIEDDLNKKLSLEIGSADVSKIYEYFENIAKEVI
jgi:hypothetical protein